MYLRTDGCGRGSATKSSDISDGEDGTWRLGSAEEALRTLSIIRPPMMIGKVKPSPVNISWFLPCKTSQLKFWIIDQSEIHVDTIQGNVDNIYKLDATAESIMSRHDLHTQLTRLNTRSSPIIEWMLSWSGAQRFHPGDGNTTLFVLSGWEWTPRNWKSELFCRSEH